MNAIPFDTLKMARRLEAAGFSGAQAAGAVEAMVEAMAGAELATKADVQTSAAEVRAELRSEIASVRSDMTAMETRLFAAITKVANDLDILRRGMTIRLGATAIASTGIILAAMRLMLPR